MTKRAPIGIELFAGCGGMSTGFLDAGLHVAAGFELDDRAVDAYGYNHAYRGSKGFKADLAEASGKSLLQTAGIKKVDFIVGGPPCQPFSIVGKRLGTADPRADLLSHFASIVEELSPKAFLFENVPNLGKIDEGQVLARFLSRVRKLGFAVRAEVVAAADYGVPQLRKRLVVLGLRGANRVKFPEPTHGPLRLPYVSTADAIGDLPDAAEFGACGIFNHEPTFHSPDMRARLSKLQPGKREKGSFHDRLHSERLSYTLRAGSGNFSPLRPIHYEFDRVITVRESARIQSFSDEFIWPDRIPRLQQYRQVGNAVPPLMARAFAISMAEQCEWKLTPKKFVGDATGRPAAMAMSDDERLQKRLSRTRGASLGLRLAG